MTEFKIEKNIPIPTSLPFRQRNRFKKLKELPLDKLEIGNSLLVSYKWIKKHFKEGRKGQKAFQGRIIQWGKFNNKMIVTRRLPLEEGVRIWHVK